MRETEIEIFGKEFTIKLLPLKVRLETKVKLANLGQSEFRGDADPKKHAKLRFDILRNSIVTPATCSKEAEESEFWQFFEEWESEGISEDTLDNFSGEVIRGQETGETINSYLVFEKLFAFIFKLNYEGRVAELEKKSIPSEANSADSTK